MNTELLITEILNRPPIWQTKHPQHKLRHVIKRLWEEIKQRVPGYDVEQLKKKWKNLKDTYRKELKKISTTPRSGDPGSDGDDSSHWRYFSLMSFLKEDFMPVEGDSNLTELENEDFSLDVSSPSEAPSPPTPTSPRPRDISPAPVATGSQSDTPLLSRKRSKANDIRAEYLEIEKKSLKYWKKNWLNKII